MRKPSIYNRKDASNETSDDITIFGQILVTNMICDQTMLCML